MSAHIIRRFSSVVRQVQAEFVIIIWVIIREHAGIWSTVFASTTMKRIWGTATGLAGWRKWYTDVSVPSASSVKGGFAAYDTCMMQYCGRVHSPAGRGKAHSSKLVTVFIRSWVQGQTPEETAGLARAMRAKCVPVFAGSNALDICGTGGDGIGSVNISTGMASPLLLPMASSLLLLMAYDDILSGLAC